MGSSAKQFAKKIRDMGFSLWQVLPLVGTDDTGSPYCSVSAFAGNISLIDPEGLYEMGLISKSEAQENEFSGSIYRTDFDFAYEKRIACLRKAFLKADKDILNQVEIFKQQNSWVEDFSYFMALSDKFQKKPWYEWDEEFARYEKAKAQKGQFQNEIDFYCFTQYIFFWQYRTLKEYCGGIGLEILGDMPIYVSMNSADVWAQRGLFEINEKSLAPKRVAGVPPDYFSEDGQLWGNPLYNWDEMEKQGYDWWLQRLSCAMKLYDVVRIDHFRAFASFWAVPAESETAKVGEWCEGPGMKLFSVVKEKLPEANIVAEDLGTFGEDVVKLLKDSGFPGMRVVQFGFDVNSDSTHLPHNYGKNTVAYVGTHDNNTILGWLWDASESERNYALRYCCFGGNNWGEGGERSPSCRAVIEAVWRSHANTVIVAVQDMLGFGKDTRMNTPGTSEDNWTFRVSEEALSKIDTEYFKEINIVYRRW